jgi:hypothetical protein
VAGKSGYSLAMLQHPRSSVSKREATLIAAALAASLLLSTGCKGSSESASAGGAGGSFAVDAGTCSPDPLHTGLAPLFNGNSVDMDDCPILEFTAKYGEPDAMIFKAIIYVESRFQYDAVGCTGNSNCCPARGWTGPECGCLGSMQTGPWCNPSNLPPGCSASDLGVLADGHVDLETNPSAGDWANSVFNPAVNIDLGIAGIACNRAQAKAQFSGCTEDQYTMMAVGNFNSYGSTKSCTVYNFAYDSSVLDAYTMYSTAAGWPAHPYVAQ